RRRRLRPTGHAALVLERARRPDALPAGHAEAAGRPRRRAPRRARPGLRRDLPAARERVALAAVGTWGIGLYENDDASDLREDFKDVVRAPWNGERLRLWARDQFPDDSPDVRLALADLFRVYRIDHAGVRDEAVRIVAGGVDADTKRALGLDERGLARRAKVLDALVEKWRTPNPKPRARRMLARPELFVLDEGACLVYPTS